MLQGKKLGLLVTGGIAAYKVADLARRLIKAGAQVRVAMTQEAQAFITPLSLQTLTKQAVLVDIFDEFDPTNVQHIEFAQWLDLAVVVPATANTIGNIANGLAPDIVSSVALALPRPGVIAPAMNDNMYANPATQRNLQQLVQDGWTIIEPEVGFLAEGYEAKGRLADLDQIVDSLKLTLARLELPQYLAGKRVVVTAGGTIERIDPVRYLSNDSSGKMGYALAQAATWYGADDVVLITTKRLPLAPGIQAEYVESARQMQALLEAKYDDTDYVVMAAAISDYRVAHPEAQKMKRSGQVGETFQLELLENPDILQGLGQKKTHQVLIGFAAETQEVLRYAREKLVKKRADWIVANDVSQADSGFNVDTNQVTMLHQDGASYAFNLMSKLDTAVNIWGTIYEHKDEV